MRVSFLGTGDAGGVPLYGCDCVACLRARADTAYRRRNCSALIETRTTRILLDAGLTDLTDRFPPGSLSAILVTHFHPDHVQGLLHLRWGRGTPIPVFAPPDSEGCADLYKNHGLLQFQALAKFEAVTVGDLCITPLPLIHSRPTFGYAIEDQLGARFAYLTDTSGLPPRTESFLQAWQPDGMAIDCCHPPREQAPRNHNDFSRALDCLNAAGIGTGSETESGTGNATGSGAESGAGWLTHLGHDFDLWEMGNQVELPPGVRIARDGETVYLRGRLHKDGAQ